jgi:hypothetical protein
MYRVLALLLLTSCSAAHRAQMQEKHASSSLSAAAEAYWFAVRWNDPDAAGTFLDTPEARLGLTRLVDAHTLRLSDAQVVRVEVGPEHGDRRDGLALVRVEAYAAAGTKLVQDVIEQHWVLTEGHTWMVDTAKSPVTAERLW